jgi:ATP phosphoribosyltransferase
MCRAQEMSRYVENGTLDCGLTGKDWIMENDSQVVVVADLMYSKSSQNPVRWVLAVPADSPIRSLKDLAGKKIATELVNYTRRYFEARQIPVKVEFSWGATEAKVAAGLVDAVVEVTETGSTIRAHGLKIIHEFFQSNTQLIANPEVWENDHGQTGKDRKSHGPAFGGAPGRTHGGPEDELPGRRILGKSSTCSPACWLPPSHISMKPTGTPWKWW